MNGRLVVSLALLAVVLQAPAAWPRDAQRNDAPAGAESETGRGSGGLTAAEVRALRGEWRRAGAGFACTVGTSKKLDAKTLDPVVLANACLHMGPFKIGDEARILASLGRPARSVPQPKGATAFLFFLDGPNLDPYLIATVLQNRIVALQVTGPAAAKGYSFNGLDLGNDLDALTRIFGRPTNISPSEMKDTEMWSYGVWPFSFEVKGGRVTSIRIADPTF